jgi:hypothetical protein
MTVWRLEHPDYMKTWCLEHPDYMKVWDLEHPDYRKIEYLERSTNNHMYHGTELLKRLAAK